MKPRILSRVESSESGRAPENTNRIRMASLDLAWLIIYTGLKEMQTISTAWSILSVRSILWIVIDSFGVDMCATPP
jgi:hypothetical protein